MSVDADEWCLSDRDADGRRTLSLTRTPTVLLVIAANRFTRAASRHYQSRFGIGAMDWRLMVMLTLEPDIPMTRAAQVIQIDKAAVSRSLSRLDALGLARGRVTGSNARRKLWRLTPAGIRLHDEILDVALQRQRQMLDGFTDEEVDMFSELLRRFMVNLEALDPD